MILSLQDGWNTFQNSLKPDQELTWTQRTGPVSAPGLTFLGARHRSHLYTGDLQVKIRWNVSAHSFIKGILSDWMLFQITSGGGADMPVVPRSLAQPKKLLCAALSPSHTICVSFVQFFFLKS